MTTRRTFTRKLPAIIRKGPAIARNMVFSRLGVWPVSSLNGSDLEALPAYCISLNRAVAKRRLISRQADGLGLKAFQFIDAIDARSLHRSQLLADSVIDDSATLRYHAKVLTLNEIACSLSHRLAYQTIVDRQDWAALIIEDDALFHSQRCRNLRFDEFPAKFDCIFLNAFLDNEPPRGHLTRNLYSDVSYAGSSAAYIVSAIGARKLLRCSLPVLHAADGLLGRGMKRSPDETHAFRGQGVPEQWTCHIIYPDCVINGSVAHYHLSDVQNR